MSAKGLEIGRAFILKSMNWEEEVGVRVVSVSSFVQQQQHGQSCSMKNLLVSF